MNRRGHASLKMWLMGAAAIAVPSALGILGPDETAFADGKLSFNPTAKKSAAKVSPAVIAEPPRLLPATDTSGSVIQTVSDSETLASTDAGQKSEIMKQLELLYEKDGREMPDLQTIQPIPNGSNSTGASSGLGQPATISPTQPTSATPLRTQNPSARTISSTPGTGSNFRPAAPSATPSPASPAPTSKNPVTGFFKKLMPGQKVPKSTGNTAQSQTIGGAQSPIQSAAPARLPEYAPAQVRTNSASGLGTATNTTVPRSVTFGPATPLVNPAAEPANFNTAPALSNVAIMPAATAELPPLATGSQGTGLTASSDFALPALSNQPQSVSSESSDDSAAVKPSINASQENLFSEMSEEEADQDNSSGPYTGLTLDEPAKASPESDKQETATATNASNDPFADELRKLGILPPAEVEATTLADGPKLSLPAPTSPSLEGLEDHETREKMLKIRERGGMKGLKGFCPVTLHDERELVDARQEFHATYRGQKFHFASDEAKIKFELDPSLYAPAAYGADVVALTRDKDVVEGSLDNAAWFKGRLYLFGSDEAHDTFVANPIQYATPAGIE